VPDLFETGGTSVERPKSYGLGPRREGVLMELFVLTESGDLVGVFSSREKTDRARSSLPDYRRVHNSHGRSRGRRGGV